MFIKSAQHRMSAQQEEAVETPPLTRSGYVAGEAFRCYEVALSETGAIASGKALHFAADLVCSGGFDLWVRAAYTFSLQNIGLASSRIFVYLRKKIEELDKKARMLPTERFYADQQVQEGIGEVVLVLQLCPKRSKLVWPKVPGEAREEGWLRTVSQAPETAAVRRVYRHDGDNQSLLWAGCEICASIQEGNSARALFWVRWICDEDARLRRETKGTGLTRVERGPPTMSTKGRTEAGHFVCALLAEIYKEFASKGQIRMHEEFQELIYLWRAGEPRIAARLRRDCLGWMVLALVEVPRLRVPAAPILIQDQTRLSRAVSQTSQFFREVLANPPLPPGKALKLTLSKAREKKVQNKEQKELTLEDQLNAFDAMIEAYLAKS
jgi:hypothetical protein